MRFWLLLPALVLLTAIPASAQFIRVDSVFVRDINSTGSTFIGTKQGDGTFESLRWTQGMLGPLVGIPDSVAFSASLISGGGDIIVGGDGNTDPRVIGTLIGNEYSPIDLPGTEDEFGTTVISDDGSTVGGDFQQLQPSGNRMRQAAVLDLASETVTILPLPEGANRELRSEVLGLSLDGSVRVGFQFQSPGTALRWDGTTVSKAPLATVGGIEPENAVAVAVSANGSIVLGKNTRFVPSTGDTAEELWLWSGSTVTQIPPYPGYVVDNFNRWDAIDLSADGTIVLADCSAADEGPLCLWDAENGWRFVKDLVRETGTDVSTINFTDDGWLSQDGQVVVARATDTTTGVRFTFVLGLKDDRIRVTSTGDQEDLDDTDDECDVSGSEGLQCTLRAAIQTANARTGADEILFEIGEGGAHVITVSSPLPSLTGPTVFDGTTQPGYTDRPLITVRATGVSGDGFVLNQPDSAVLGLAVGGFGGAGIRMSGPGGGRVEASYVGVARNGTTPLPNSQGIVVDGSPLNTIGGDEPEQGNVVSGNTGAGIVVRGAASTGVVVSGNRVGTTGDGTAALGNGAEGVLVEGAPGVRIGGSSEAERNLIAGNATHGLRIEGAEAVGVSVLGNWIGLAADGTTALANGTDATARTGHHGISVVSAPNVVIGGETATPGRAPGNVIAASAAHGVAITGIPDAPADGAQVLGSLIGTDRSGTTARVGGQEAVYLYGAARNAQIGEAGAGNVIVAGTTGEGNNKGGIWLFDLGEAGGAPDGAVIAANTIGLNAAGSAVLGEVATAVAVLTEADDGGVERVVIGGDALTDGNRIRATFGVGLFGPKTSGTVVASNTIGLLASGQLARTERDATGLGLFLVDGVQIVSNTIGGQLIGVILAGSDAVVVGNQIGTNRAGTAARPNTIGVFIPGRLTDGPDVGDRNVIGAPGAGNVISGNQFDAIRIGGEYNLGDPEDGLRPEGAGAARIAASPPTLRSGAEAEVARGGGLATLLAPSRSFARDTALAVRRSLTGTPDSTVIAFNRIGTTLSGTRELGNGRGSPTSARAAIWVTDGRGTLMLGNVISGNGGGVLVTAPEDEDGDPKETVIAGSLIGGAIGSGAALPNQYGGVFYFGSEGNRMEARPVEEGGDPVGNIVQGNGEVGVAIRPIDGETSNRIRATSFLNNRGVSLLLLNGELEYPSNAPPPPTVLSAVRTEDGARLRATGDAAGDVDVFASPRCDGGNAEGLLVGSATVSGGRVEVPVTSLAPGASPLNQYLALTLTPTATNRTTSAFSDCIRITRARDATEVDVTEGETGPVLTDVGIDVEVTENGLRGGATGGTLYAARYGPTIPPIPSPLDTQARTPAGPQLRPNTVARDRHWTLRADGLEGVTYDVCLDVDGVEGVLAPDQLVVVHRPRPDTAWTAYDSSLDGSRLCASGLTAWGDLGLGADSLANPVPAEPGVALPATAALAAPFPNPARGVVSVPYALPAPAPVRLTVIDALGREVARLVDGPRPAGHHTARLDTGPLPSGVYLMRVEIGDALLVRSLVVAR